MHDLKKEKLKRSFGLALDILFTLVLLFSISMVVSTLSMRKDFFGFRLGIVQSNSMEASDLYLGDVVSISKQSDYQIGDILVFYLSRSVRTRIDELDLYFGSDALCSGRIYTIQFDDSRTVFLDMDSIRDIDTETSVVSDEKFV